MRIFHFLFPLSLILAACSSAPQAASIPTQSGGSQTLAGQPTSATTSLAVKANTPSSPTPGSEEQPSPSMQDLVRYDDQGQITVEVTPADLNNPGETLEFEVGLNTHSVDLSMDLASLATLTTDTGKAVQASQWDAPGGGHHVSGKLIFPAKVEGRPILEGAKKLTLIIKNLDVPERVLSWDLNP